MHENIIKTIYFVLKIILLYNVLFLRCVTIMQSVLKVNGLMVKRIFMQSFFILYDYLSENFIRYSFLYTLNKTEVTSYHLI